MQRSQRLSRDCVGHIAAALAVQSPAVEAAFDPVNDLDVGLDAARASVPVILQVRGRPRYSPRTGRMAATLACNDPAEPAQVRPLMRMRQRVST